MERFLVSLSRAYNCRFSAVDGAAMETSRRAS
jgi:hypothetical protein